MSRQTDPESPISYVETFDAGPGGWHGWVSNHEGYLPLEWSVGSITARRPWWID